MGMLETPFGFHSTAEEVLRDVDLSKRIAVVTGAASGIGLETAAELARAGAEVVLAVRDVGAGNSAVARIRARVPRARLKVRWLDLDDLNSVRAFAAQWSGPLHILVNNAGIMATPVLQRGPTGWEGQMATNYLGHFALTQWLKNALIEAGTARVVCLSSSAHLLSPVVFDDLHFRFMRYDPLSAYGQSKTACALMAVELSQRWGQKYGIWANSVNPGAIATKLQRNTGGLKTPIERQKTPAQGAATSSLLAGSPLVEGVGGRYFEDCNEAVIVAERSPDYRGVAPYALDLANAAHLWDVTMRSLDV
jgi:NAD(P)-dependent dehydrogenase (short-subunit alcohol dehydrogenase family)